PADHWPSDLPRHGRVQKFPRQPELTPPSPPVPSIGAPPVPSAGAPPVPDPSPPVASLPAPPESPPAFEESPSSPPQPATPNRTAELKSSKEIPWPTPKRALRVICMDVSSIGVHVARALTADWHGGPGAGADAREHENL